MKYMMFFGLILLLLVQTNYFRHKSNKILENQQIIIDESKIKLSDEILLTKSNFLTDMKYKSSKNYKNLPNVAHAGGTYKGMTYTNSLEALEINKDKYEYFEIDFSPTSDGVYVCSHGWSKNERNLALGDGKEGAPSFQEFLEKRKKHKWTACTLEEVVNWAIINNKKIVTDIKESNVEALSNFIKVNEKNKDTLIPQIYNIHEYEKVNQLGFTKIILTLYATDINESDLSRWLIGKNIYAITTWHHRAPYITKLANDIGIPVYIHTVNSKEIAEYLKTHYGIQGIYTDELEN